jgi:4-amino-4-deoxy-L-arabinose transferase-like glycosyltransferase
MSTSDSGIAIDNESPRRARGYLAGYRPLIWPTLIWLAMAVPALLARPPLVSVESPLHAALWWLWQHRDDVPYLPTAPGELPPLFTAVVLMAWRLFGVSDLWARLLPGLFVLAAIWGTRPLARLVWGEESEAARFAPLILAGSGGIAAYAAMTLPELCLLPFHVLALCGLASYWRHGQRRGWVVAGLALGLGTAGAGPLALLTLAPIAILLPWIAPGRMAAARRRWFTGCVLALAIAATLVALIYGFVVGDRGLSSSWLWRLPAYSPIARVGVTRPFYWYLVILPLALYPWLWWRVLWRAAARGRPMLASPESRFCLLATLCAVAAGILSGSPSYGILTALPPLAVLAGQLLGSHAGRAKDFHAAIPGLTALFVCLFFFLLNIVPVAHLNALWQDLFAEDLPLWLGGISLGPGMLLLLGSYGLTLLTLQSLQARLLQVALLPVLLSAAVNLEFRATLHSYFDLDPIASQIRLLESRGVPIAIAGGYDGAFDFAGRLKQPPVVVPDQAAALAWAAANPEGTVISFFQGGILRLPKRPLFLGNADEYRVAVWPAETVIDTQGAVLAPRF